MFYHCMPLNYIKYDILYANKKYSLVDNKEKLTSFVPAYEWMEKEVGFYPFWVSVNDIKMTGYQNQWRKCISKSYNYLHFNEYRLKGEFPNYVLFGWRDMNGVFSCYNSWHIVLCHENYQISMPDKRRIFKYSWKKSKWLNYAKKNAVQMVVPSLDLRTANKIFVRNKTTKNQLELMGFKNINVKRIKL